MAVTYYNGSYPGLTNGSGTTVCIAQLGIEKTNETATTVTYSLGVYIYCVNYAYETSGVLSTALSCTGQTTRTTSGGGCDISAGQRLKLSPSSGNWTYTFSKTANAYSRTIGFTLTSTGRSVSGTSSGSYTISIPALAKYTVSYNANGGTGSIEPQNKYYGNNLTLSNGTDFTRTNHTLTGWNTEADGSGTPYALGATYTDNAPLTLYAQWHMDYIKPTITSANAYRVDSASSSEATDNGEFIYITFSYTGGKQPTDESYTSPSCSITIDDEGVLVPESEANLHPSGNWPTRTIAFGGEYSVDQSHTVKIKLSDKIDTEGTTVTLIVGIPTFPIDLKTSGNNTYMGVMTAAQDGTLLSVPSVHVINAISQNSIKIGNSFVVDFVVEEGQEVVTQSGTSPSNGFGDGYWRWREWYSGKVEIWYNGSVMLNTPAGSTAGVYRYLRRITFPNQYALYHCIGIVDGTVGGNWLNCGGLFGTNPQSGAEEHIEPYIRIEVMAYSVTSAALSNKQTNVNIYICGEKNN